MNSIVSQLKLSEAQMVEKKRALGHNLEAVLDTVTRSRTEVSIHKPTSLIDTFDDVSTLQFLSIDHLQRGKYQPRKDINPESLQELASSIRIQGILQPIVVRPISKKKYEIIAGERRWRAAKLAGLAEVPTLIRDVSDEAAIAIALIENMQREDLNPIEEAMTMDRLCREFEMTHQQVAEAVGKSREAITNLLRLMKLQPVVKQMLEEGSLDMGHARALLTLDAEPQIRLAQQIIEEKLSVREAEKLVNNIKNPLREAKSKVIPFNDHERYYYWSAELTKKFSSKVTVKLNQEGRGEIIIHVDSPEQIDKLIERKL